MRRVLSGWSCRTVTVCIPVVLLCVSCEPPADETDSVANSALDSDTSESGVEAPEPVEVFCANGECSCPATEECLLTCSGFCTASCGLSSECFLNCPQGSCRLNCAPGSDCSLSCPAGGCVLTCPAGARCQSACPGGSCPCIGAGCP
jgi:hypothetical protein